MKRKLIDSLRLLLVAAGLCVGAVSAWADATVIYGRAMETSGDYTAWSSADVAASGTNVWIGDLGYNETYGLYASGQGNRESIMTFSHTDNSLQTFDIVFNNLGNTGNASNYSYIKIGSDIEIRSNQQSQNGAVIINGTSTAISDCNQKNYNRGGDSWTIHVEINTAKKVVTALTLEGTPGTYGSATKYAHYTLSGETALSTSATFNTVTVGFKRSGGTPSVALTSIKIAEEAQEVTTAGYTINYQFGGSTIKTVEGIAAVGATVYAESPITIEGTKYYAADDATTSMGITSGTNTLNVTLREAYTYSYTVKASTGATLSSGTGTEGESITYSWPAAINVGGVLYTTPAVSSQYKSTFVLDSDNKEVTVNYTAQSTTNVVYLVEGENIAGATINTTGTNVAIRASNAAAASIPTGGVAVCTLPAGTYSLNLWMSHTRNDAEVTTTFGYGETEFTVTKSGTNRVQVPAKEFTLTETSTLVCKSIAGNGLLDNLYITGTPDNEIIGALDYSTAFMGAAKSMTISQGETIKATFKNHGNDASNWYNWLVRLSGTTGVNHTLRADNYVIGDDGSTVSTRDIKENGGAINWKDFSTDMKDSEVEMTITYTLGGMFSITATSTGTNTYTHTFAYNAAKSGAITVELGVDHAWLEVLSVEKTVSKAIGSYGYATFSSTYALDFTDVTDATAYIATSKSGDKINMQAINGKVAAGTGLVLKSTCGSSATINIPVTASGTTYNTESATKNYLFAINSDYNLTASKDGTNYVLSVQDEKVVFAPIGATAAPVTAGHAALWIPAVGARMLEMSFADDETTGISQIENGRLNIENSVYNLNGQRVTKPSKGLYIVGGKKVILK